MSDARIKTTEFLEKDAASAAQSSQKAVPLLTPLGQKTYSRAFCAPPNRNEYAVKVRSVVHGTTAGSGRRQLRYPTRSARASERPPRSSTVRVRSRAPAYRWQQ